MNTGISYKRLTLQYDTSLQNKITIDLPLSLENCFLLVGELSWAEPPKEVVPKRVTFSDPPLTV